MDHGDRNRRRRSQEFQCAGSPLFDFGAWSTPYNKKINNDNAAALTKA